MSEPTAAGAHTESVIAAFASADSPRLVELTQALVRHLHAFSTEVGLTRAEWEAGIGFLTAVGQTCTEQRQELILLSDVLGESMLVELIAGVGDAAATEPTVLGPFYLPDAPARAFGASIVDRPDTGGSALVLSGQVRDPGERAIPGASVDIWQVQPNRLYDVQEAAGVRNLRGVFITDIDGRYEVTTVRPVDYTIPSDGPVGTLLRATRREPWRAAHIHLKVSAPGFLPVVTHVFDAESPHLGTDAVFGVRASLVADMSGGRCHFDPVLSPVASPA